MPFSPGDIITIGAGHGSVLIGSGSAFGPAQDFMRVTDGAQIRALLRLASRQGTLDPGFRRHMDRWGQDIAMSPGTNRASLVEWLARKAEQRQLSVGFAPDLTLAFVRFADLQEHLSAAVAAGSTVADDEIPESMEERFLLVVRKVMRHVRDDADSENAASLSRVNETRLAAALLAWTGASFRPGLQTVLIAHDLRTMPAIVFAAVEDMARAINDIASAMTPEDLDRPFTLVLRSITTMIKTGILHLFLQARTAVRSPSDADGPTIRKPKRQAEAAENQRKSRRPQASGGGAGQSGGAGSGGGGAGGGKARESTVYTGPESQKASDELGARAMTGDGSVLPADESPSDNAMYRHEQAHAAGAQHGGAGTGEPADADEAAADRIGRIGRRPESATRGGGDAANAAAAGMAGDTSQAARTTGTRAGGLDERRMADGNSVYTGPAAQKAAKDLGAQAFSVSDSLTSPGDDALYTHERLHTQSIGDRGAGSPDEAGREDEASRRVEQKIFDAVLPPKND